MGLEIKPLEKSISKASEAELFIIILSRIKLLLTIFKESSEDPFSKIQL